MPMPLNFLAGRAIADAEPDNAGEPETSDEPPPMTDEEKAEIEELERQQAAGGPGF